MENKLTSLEQMRQAMQEAAGLSRKVAAAAAGAIQEVAEDKQDKLTVDGTLTLQSGEVSALRVTEPTRILKRAEYDALPEEEKNRGLFIIEDEDGGAGGVEMATELPQAAGEASAGTSERCAREDHVHPAQTDITGNAGTATKLQNTVMIDGFGFDGQKSVIHYGKCASEASATVKEISGYAGTPNKYAGMRVAVQFVNANTAEEPKLKFRLYKDEYPVMLYGTTPAGANAWEAGEIVEFIYDGTNFVMVDGAIRAAVGMIMENLRTVMGQIQQIQTGVQEIETAVDDINGEVI